jgi:hypothetical protein
MSITFSHFHTKWSTISNNNTGCGGGTVVEFSTRHPQSEGSSPAAGTWWEMKQQKSDFYHVTDKSLVFWKHFQLNCKKMVVVQNKLNFLLKIF